VRLGLCLASLLGAASGAATSTLAAAEGPAPRDIEGCVLWLKGDAGLEVAGDGSVIKW